MDTWARERVCNHSRRSPIYDQALAKTAGVSSDGSSTRATPLEVQTGMCAAGTEVLNWDDHKPPKTCLGHLKENLLNHAVDHAEWDKVEGDVR